MTASTAGLARAAHGRDVRFAHRFRRAGAAVASLTIIVGVSSIQPSATEAATATYFATADAHVDSTSPTSNFGGATRLKVKDSSSRDSASYLRFEVSGFGTATSATLRLYVTDGGPDGGTVHAVGGWDEADVTWNTRPAPLGPSLGSSGAVAAGAWVEIDLSGYITGDGVWNLGLLGGTADTVVIHSREASKDPQLVLTGGSSTPPAATPTPTPSTAVPPTGAVTPDADAYVASAYPTKNYGTSAELKVRAPSAELLSYLRFSVAGQASVTSAVLRLYVTNGSPGGGTVHSAGNSAWDERQISWNERPDIGSALGSLGSVAAGSWIEIDVSASVAGNGSYTFAIVGDSTNTAAYSSREGANRPQLVVNGAPGSSPPGGGGPANISLPLVSQAGPERDVHFARVGTWSGSGSLSYAYQWERCDGSGADCKPILGANTSRYQLTSDDVGQTLRAVVTASDSTGSSVAASAPTSPVPPPASPASGDPVIAAAGDIACAPTHSSFNGGQGTTSFCRQLAVSDLLTGRGLSGVLALGDTQYEDGTYDAFLNSYDLSWGRVNGITYPAPGNHEYNTHNAAGYYRYFGASAGDPTEGWYSFDLGTWHLVALNSNCADIVGGCGVGSPQERWLRADLAANAKACTLAFWHHPRFSSGNHGSSTDVAALWDALEDFGADVALVGHDHHYERFARLNNNGAPDPAGIRQFVVGGGGKSLRGTSATPVSGSEVRNSDTFGVLELTLHPAAYSWEFRAASGSPTPTFMDTGTDDCTALPAGDPNGSPSASFTHTPTAGEAPLTVRFTDTSLNAESWSWDFDGDGTEDSTAQHPSYTYTSSGTYSPALSVSNAVGSDSATGNVTVRSPIVGITATAETRAVPHSGDAADDAAIWVDPIDPSRSVVIGTDKQTGGGLAIYDLSGAELAYYADGGMNNVDLRDGFNLGEEAATIVTATSKEFSRLAIYRFDPSTRTLTDVAARIVPFSSKMVGLCMYRSPISGKTYVFVNGSGGKVDQYELSDSGGSVDVALVRSFDVGTVTEGCVADDELAHFYISEETVGIWRYSAEPDASEERVLVDVAGAGGHLVADIEGLAIAYGPSGTGYLVASSQGNDAFVVYRRDGYDHVRTVRIIASPTIDGVEHTDGIDLTTAPLGSQFPGGLLVVQDGSNRPENQNFKYVPLDSVLPAPGP